MHRGHHYPRSQATAQQPLAGQTRSAEEYAASVFDNGRHLYAVAVELAIHHRSVGTAPEVPPNLLPCLDHTVIARPQYTNFEKFVAHGSRFIPILAEARQIGSMYTVRTVEAARQAVALIR